MADVAHEGESSVINEDSLGNDRTLLPISISRQLYSILTVI